MLSGRLNVSPSLPSVDLRDCLVFVYDFGGGVGGGGGGDGGGGGVWCGVVGCGVVWCGVV